MVNGVRFDERDALGSRLEAFHPVVWVVVEIFLGWGLSAGEISWLVTVSVHRYFVMNFTD